MKGLRDVFTSRNINTIEKVLKNKGKGKACEAETV